MRTSLHKIVISLCLLGLGAMVAPAQTAADKSPPGGESAYVVKVDALVGETGAVEQASVVFSEDEILSDIALKVARAQQLPVRTKDGVAIKYHAQLPFAFPVEGDGGAEVQKTTPIPKARVQPGPQYPYEQARSGVPGGVILSLLISESGKISEVKVVRSSHKVFEQPAVAAVRKWTFQPVLQEGKPVAVRLFQAITFSTDEKNPEWRWYLAPRPCLQRFEVTGAWLRAND